MDNGPARKNRIAENLQALGEEVGDPFEISTVRREVCPKFWNFLDRILSFL